MIPRVEAFGSLQADRERKSGRRTHKVTTVSAREPPEWGVVGTRDEYRQVA